MASRDVPSIACMLSSFSSGRFKISACLNGVLDRTHARVAVGGDNAGESCGTTIGRLPCLSRSILHYCCPFWLPSNAFPCQHGIIEQPRRHGCSQ